MEAPTEDPKSQLVQFCQSYCKRPLTKEDIVYTTSKFDTQYQAIVKLNCLGGQEYAGNLTAAVKEAEKDAAVQTLTAYSAEIAAIQAAKDSTPSSASACKRKRPAPAPTLAEQTEKQARLEAGENPAFTPKVKLNSLCMKIAKRFLQKGETTYKCLTVPGGFQATVQLLCLPDDWKDRVWAGHISCSRQKAEQSAAEIALQQILEDPQMMEEANKAQAMKGGHRGGSCNGKGGKGGDDGKGSAKSNSGDKGGKGWGGKGWGMDWGAPSWPAPWSWGGPQAWGQGGKWKSKDGGKKKDSSRQRVSDSPMLGAVVEWKGQYAWVKPHGQIEHKAAKSRGGKVYVHKNDLTDGVESLVVGQTVRFFVYEDGSGLGGEEVQVVSG